MPGSIIFKPIEANLTHNTDLIGKMNPYCAVNVGGTMFKGQVCKKGGKHPIWNDSITIPTIGTESTAIVDVMDKDRITHDDHIGSFVLDLTEVQSLGQVSKWYPLSYKNKPAGEILIEAMFQPESSLGGYSGEQMGMQTGLGGTQTGLMGSEAGLMGTQGGLIGSGAGLAGSQGYQGEYLSSNKDILQQENISVTQPGLQQGMINQSAGFVSGDISHASGFACEEKIVNKVSGFEQRSNIYTEQRQVVEPHTFMRDVEVVETRPVLKEIEVFESHKVVRDVPVTEAVPVTKQIEVTEPQVVLKDVEVIEPRVVTKTIQVVENVPVTKQVEVIEPRTFLQEVQSYEPQTFTKQVEVTETVPVKRVVEVTEPVTLKKPVEFVQPIITTKTITKEMQQPVIVDEKITTHVGPASLLHTEAEYRQQGFVSQFNQMNLSEEQRLLEQQRWSREGGFGQSNLGNLTEEQRLLEQERLSREGRFGQRNLGTGTTYTSTLENKDTIGPGTLDSNYVQPKP
jgi:hypothetical protein